MSTEKNQKQIGFREIVEKEKMKIKILNVEPMDEETLRQMAQQARKNAFTDTRLRGFWT